jgi:hypothetical protein
MPRMDPNALSAIERTPASPSALSKGLWDVLSHSISSRAKVEGFNNETGELVSTRVAKQYRACQGPVTL